MTLELEALTIDAHDPERLARFWAEVLDYKITYDSIQDPDSDGTEREINLEPQSGRGIPLLFIEVHDKKEVKNRLHLDLRPEDQNAEVDRVEQLGASRVDIGQGDVTWVVLADPEGNEFCILRANSTSE